MKVQDVMTQKTRVCYGDTSLAEAAQLMWNHDCGILPVLESTTGRLVGVITDRDICIGAAMVGDSPHRVPVRHCCSRGIHTCRPGDDVQVAHRLMREHRVRRIPVVVDDDQVVGIVSIDDLAIAALHGRGARSDRAEVGLTLARIRTGGELVPREAKEAAQS